MAMSMSASEHYRFRNERTAFKSVSRLDGQPWCDTGTNVGDSGTAFTTLAAFIKQLEEHPMSDWTSLEDWTRAYVRALTRKRHRRRASSGVNSDGIRAAHDDQDSHRHRRRA